MIALLATPSGGSGRRGEYFLDGVPDLVDLLERGQEVHGPGLLPVVELLAVEVHFDAAAVGGGHRDCRFAIVDRGELSRHTDGNGEVTSDDAVDDLDVDFTFGHGSPPWRFGVPHVSGILSTTQWPSTEALLLRQGASPMVSSTTSLRFRRCHGSEIGIAQPAGAAC